MTKLKSIILHIGPDKTGSTAIQYTLAENVDLLESCGVLYSGGTGRNDKALALAFSKNIRRALSRNSGRKPKRDHGYVEKLQQRVKSSSADHLILSHEGLIHLTAEELWALREFLTGMSERVIVVLYARDPFSYALSAMSQRVKTGRRAWNYNPPVIAYQNHIEQWADVFGREALDVRLFSREVFPGGDVVLDFISMSPLKEALSDLDVSKLKQPFKGNPGFSDLAIRVGDRIVAILGDAEAPKGKIFKDLFFDDLSQLGSGKAELMPKQQKRILSLSRRHTEYLAREFNIVFPELKKPVKQTTLFSERDVEALACKFIAAGFQMFGWAFCALGGKG